MAEIFSGKSIEDAYLLKRKTIAAEGMKVAPEVIRNNSTEDIIGHKLKELVVEPAKVKENEIRYTREEVIIGETKPMPGWKLVWRLPISGSPEVIDFQKPQQLTIECDHSVFLGNAILLTQFTADHSLRQAFEWFRKDLRIISTILEHLAGKIAAENIALRRYAEEFIEARRALWSVQNPDSILGYPGNIAQ